MNKPAITLFPQIPGVGIFHGAWDKSGQSTTSTELYIVWINIIIIMINFFFFEKSPNFKSLNYMHKQIKMQQKQSILKCSNNLKKNNENNWNDIFGNFTKKEEAVNFHFHQYMKVSKINYIIHIKFFTRFFLK